MLAVIIGPYERRLALKESALPGATSAHAVSGDDLTERASGVSLFSEKRAYRIEDVEVDELLARAPALALSQHLFIFETEKMLAGPLAALKKAGAQVLEAKSEGKAPRLNSFILADALGARDRKKLWLSLTSLLRGGAPPEELAGILHWQTRSMLAASIAQSAEDAKMKEFVFGKARRHAKNYTGDELRHLSRELVALYHESHRGGGPLELLLEKFVLSL